MLFLAKSALCIGVVTVLAAGGVGGGDVRAAIETGSRGAVVSLGQACAASTDCVGLGTRIASAAITRQTGSIPDLVTRTALAQATGALAGPRTTAAAAPPVSESGSPPRQTRLRVHRVAAASD